jgi:hypothetical protein
MRLHIYPDTGVGLATGFPFRTKAETRSGSLSSPLLKIARGRPTDEGDVGKIKLGDDLSTLRVRAELAPIVSTVLQINAKVGEWRRRRRCSRRAHLKT